jgi:transglutaminase-like putative cysteine protease
VLGAPALYRVRQHYRYVYSSPIYKVKQRLVMIPPDQHGDQTLVSYDLDVRGTTGQETVDWQTDLFGNRVCRVTADQVDHALDFEVWFTVRRGGAGPRTDGLKPDLMRAYLDFTALTAGDERIKDAAWAIAGQASTALDKITLAHDWSARSITYQVGVTGTRTPAAMALHLGQGVCQDYAHIMLSLLRTLGIPARYVSGHLLGEGAPHAWVEALLADPDTGQVDVLAYDPTHHRPAEQGYITVATGRDFADVTATSGVFSGAATGKLHWSKQADVLDLPEAEAEDAAA